MTKNKNKKDKNKSKEREKNEESKNSQTQDNIKNNQDNTPDHRKVEMIDTATAPLYQVIQKGKEKTCDNLADSEQAYQMYALYSPYKDTNVSLQIMAHDWDYKNKEFTNFDTIPIEVGKHEFLVYYAQYTKNLVFRPDYQLKVIREEKYLGISKTWDYYETENFHRPLQDGSHQFIFNTKIVRNSSHYMKNDPPGASITQATDELLYYSVFCIQTDRINALQALLLQFQKKYTMLPHIDYQSCQKFSQVYDTIIQAHKETLDNFIKSVLDVHGLLPLKLNNINGFKMTQTPLILKQAANFFVREYLEANKDAISKFSSQLSSKGYMLHILLDASTHCTNWIDSITELLSIVPRLTLVIIKQTMELFAQNNLKFNEEACQKFNLFISVIKDDIFLYQQFDLQLLLLELPGNLITFLKLLDQVISPLAVYFETDVQEESKGENSNNDSLFEGAYEALDEMYISKTVTVIDKYLKSNVVDITSVLALIIQARNFQPQVIKLFSKSQANKIIGQVFNDRKIYSKENLIHFRTLFIDNYSPKFLKEIKFESVIKKLIVTESMSFIQVYTTLLIDWPNNAEMNKEYSTIQLNRLVPNTRDQAISIRQVDEFLTEICEANRDRNVYQYLEDYICIEAVEQIYTKNFQNNYKQNSFLDLVQSFTNCKNEELQNQYIFKAQSETISPNLKQYFNELLKQLLTIHSTMKRNVNSNLRLIDNLITFIFSKDTEKPTLEHVTKELIENPSIDHAWYKVIERFDQLKDHDYAKSIVDTIRKFSTNLIEQNLIIEDLLKIKNNKAHHKALCSYVNKTITDRLSLKGKSIESHVKDIIDSLDNILNQQQELAHFFSIVDQGSAHCQLFLNTQNNFLQKQLRDLNFEDEPFCLYQDTAHKMFYVRQSVIFNRYYDTEIELSPTNGDPEIIREACNRAHANLKSDLDQYIIGDITHYTMGKIRQLQSNQILDANQINREIEIFKLIVNGGDPKGKLSTLKDLMHAFSKRQKMEKLCQSLVEISQMTFHLKDPVGTTDIQMPIFNLSIKSEVDAAQNFLDVCSKNLDILSAIEYQKYYENVTKVFTIQIKNVAVQIQQRKRTAHNNHFMQQNEEVKDQEQIDKQVKNVTQIICQLSQTSLPLFQFIRVVKSEELEQLKEYVNDYDESTVSTQIVFDYIAISEYVQQFDSDSNGNPMTFKEFTAFIINNISSPKFKGIEQKITSCINQLFAIVELKNSLHSKEEAKKKQILEIMRQSNYKFQFNTQGNLNSWNISLNYSKNKSSNLFEITNILELRDRALLIQHTSAHQQREKTREDKTNNDDEQEIIGKFVTFSNLIRQVINNLTELSQYGFPIEVDSFQKELICFNSQFDSIQAFESQLSIELSEWKIDLVNAYQRSYWLTFISGRSFWEVEKHLLKQDQDPKCKQRASNILKYMRKEDVCPDQIDGIFNTPSERLDRLCQMLEIVKPLDITKKVQNFHIENMGRIKQSEKEIFFLETQQPFIGIISLYINSDNAFPRGDQLLFCNENTSWQELESFLYRCIKSPQKELYSLIRPEQLSLDIQDQCTNLITKFIKEEMKFKQSEFNFAIITSDYRSQVSSILRNQPYTRVIRDGQIMEEVKIRKIVQEFDANTLFVRSSRAGLGKSQFIREKALSEGKKLILFPITGQINYEQIGIRFAELKVDRPSIISLQISQVDNIQILNEILISLALFRVFKSSSNIFILPYESSICVEISNSFDNSFEQSIFYKNYVKEHYIDGFNLQNLQVLPVKENQPLHFVSTNLLMFKDKSIISQELDLDQIFTQDKQTCIQLFTEYFQQYQLSIGQEPSFIQMQIFIKILNYLLEGFTKCYYFSLREVKETIDDMQRNGLAALIDQYSEIRHTIMDALLMTVKEFTIKSINRNVSRNQRGAKQEVMMQGGKKDDEEEKIGEVADQFQMGLSWDQTNHFNVIFTESLSIMFIYRDPEQVPENMRRQIYIQASAAKLDGPTLLQSIQSNQYLIENLQWLDDKDLKEKLKDLSSSRGNIGKSNDDYVVTTDNFLKMNVIYLRIQAQIPVVIMGETGCGKTFLINYFCKTIRNEELIVFNIHAGVTSQIIIDRLELYENKALSIYPSKLWIFFDEFNTTENIGIICEILCERTLMGKQLMDNMCFLAACNPYKLRTKKIRFDENVGIKRTLNNRQAQQSMLLYTVHPLPDSVIEYVWDFGSLTDSDYEKYIKQMLINSQTNYKFEHKFILMITSMLLECHKYFKKHEDSSSVSLRDISRFIILYQWFKQSLLDKKSLIKEKQKWSDRYQNNLKKYNVPVEIYNRLDDIDLNASMLALCHCYFLRISSLQDRETFLHKVCAAQTEYKYLKPEYIETIIHLEQNDYLVRMDLPEATAINQALKENIFAIIPCIINKIPVFICGKPGCSKSLAISLIFANLRGTKSSDCYFKTLPELTMVSFQGSDSCTSDGILKAYERARKYLSTDAVNILPVFVFDEIGLAELSKHNPLKVLHSLLEVENRDIAFVGISNWRLDASKMNRALYLARPDPDEDDIKFTALSIYNSICQDIRDNKALIKDLAGSYYDLKQYFKTNQPDYADFYGLRDFYHLIKQVSKNLAFNKFENKEDIIRIVKIAIERNFGGKLNAASKIGDFFMKRHRIEEIYPFIESTNVLDLIKMNLADKDSRYLMLICRSDVATFILEKHFEEAILERRTIVGSNLENDLNKEQYGFRSLSDIILYIEKGISVILKDMDHIHSSLYDLFNQNFAKYEDRRYCRIALGALMNPKCFVHDNFHCIIFMNDTDKALREADGPLMNRFEKHYLSLDSVLTPDDQEVVSQLLMWVQKLLTLRIITNEELQLRETSIFPNFSKDTIGLLVLINNEKMGHALVAKKVIKCKKEMIKLATQDIIMLSNISLISEKEKQFILETYYEVHNESFLQLITQSLDEVALMQANSKKLVAFTFSIGFPFKIDESENDHFQIRNISNFKSEEELVKIISQFYASQTAKVFIIDADYIKDKEHISFIKFVVDKIEKESSLRCQVNKTLVLLVHMQRNYNELEQSSLPLFQGWDHKVYYDISKDPFNLTEDLMNTTTKNIIQQERYYNFEQLLSTLTEKCLLKLNFEGDGDRETINDNLFFIMEMITKDNQLVEAFKQKIFTNINEDVRQQDWKMLVCCNLEVFNQSINLHDAILRVIEIQIEKYLTSILYLLEKNTAFKSYFTDYNEENGENLRTIWLYVFDQLPIKGLALQNLSQSNYTSFISNLNFPFSRLEYDLLRELIIDQRSYEAKFEEGNPPVIEHFADQFNQRSKLGHHVNYLLTDIIIQRLYFSDILRIFLIDSLLDIKYEPIVQIILQKILNEQNVDFYQKLHTFLTKQQLFIGLCTILDVIIQLQGTENHFEQIKEVFDMALLEYENKTWEQMVQSILDELILDCYPEQTALARAGGIDKTAALMEKLFGMLANFGNNIKLKNLQILRFWSDFTHLAIQNGNKEIHFLVQCTLKAKQFYANNQDEDLNLIDNIDFIMNIIAHFKNSNDEYTLKFLSIFMSIIIGRNPIHILYVADEFQTRGNELYKYSSTIFQNILVKSQLLEIIDQYEQDILFSPENNEYLEMKLPQNSYFDNMEIIFSKQGITSKFGVIIADVIISKYLIDGISDRQVERNFRPFKNFMRIAYINDYDCYPNILKLISHAMIKCYLDSYTYIIYKLQNIDREVNMMEYELKNEEIPIMREIDQLICQNHLKRTLQIYCFKRLKQFLHFSLSELKIFCLDKLADKYQWAQQCDMGEIEIHKQMPVDVLPQYDESSDNERQILLFLNSIIRINDAKSKQGFIKIIQDTITDIQKISFGLAFMKGIYLKFTAADYKESIHLRQFFKEELEQQLEVRLGKEYCDLISFFISNFPQNNFLRLDSHYGQNDIQKRLVACTALIIFLSFRLSQNPLTGQFFRNGVFQVNHIKESYLCGLELPYKTEILQNLFLNFDQIKSMTWHANYAKGSAFKCGDTCDYVYIVQDCGGQVNMSQCPWCQQTIGGQNYIPYPRPGHQNLTDDEAKAYLSRLNDKHMALMPKSYSPVSPPSPNVKLTFNQLQPVSWRLLRLFLNLPLYLMHTKGQLSDNQLYDIFTTRNEEEKKEENYLREMRIEPKAFLKQHIQNDLDMLFNQLSVGGQDSPAPWLYYVLGKLVPKINTINHNPTTVQIRNDFERFFDSEIVSPYLGNVSEIAQEQRQKFMKESKEFDQLVSESIIRDYCPNLELFRLTRDFSFEDMKASFYMNPQNSSQFKQLKILLDSNDDLIRLKKFYPVIELTNYLLSRFNHMITREESRRTPICDYFMDDPILQEMFSRFLIAWNHMGFDKKIQYTCKSLDYNNRYSKDSELIHFLIDNKEPGGGMCMAAGLNELTEIQNKILNDLVTVYSKDKNIPVDLIIDTFKYPVQRVKTNHILNITVENKEMVKDCSLNNINYGEGQELVYDFSRIQLNLTKDILNKKLLRADNFEFIQYQLELITMQGDKSALIIEIRKKMKQAHFEKQMQLKIDQYFELLSKSNKTDYYTTLKQLHGGLEKLLCFLLNATTTGDKTLEEFCQTMKGTIDQRFKTMSILSQVQLCNIISLYEQIEKLYFPFITTHLRQEFFRSDNKEDIRTHMKRILDESDKKASNLPSRQQIQNALMRFMIRCLAADLDVEQPLSYYIMREDFWDEDIEAPKLDRFEEEFPKNINLDHTATTYEVIDELNKVAEKKSLAPQMNPRAEPRQMMNSGPPKIKKRVESDTV